VQANQYFLNTHVFATANHTEKPSRIWHTLDVTGTYQVSPRVNIAVTLPLSLNRMSFLVPGEAGPAPEFRQTINAHAVGDLLIMARTWVLNPEKNTKQNFQVGLGLKLPTGNFREQAVFADGTGLVRTKKVIPITIMPGDGGVDVLAELLGYRAVNFPVKHSQIFGYCNYLITPRNMNNVPSQVATSGNPALILNPAAVRSGALVNTVADTYAVRLGYVFPIPGVKTGYLKGLRLMLAYRWEGSPQRDFIGGSGGFRQPGFYMAVEPGLFYFYKNHLLTLSCPISFVRDAEADVAQQRGSPDPRTTAFSPASLNFRYTYLF
jgi:hypothetical protein